MLLAICAEVIGERSPMLFEPSVSRITTLLLAFESFSRATALAKPIPTAVPSCIKHGLKHVEQRCMVGCHRTLGKCLACEDRQADIVIRTPIDKFGGNILGGLYTIGAKVFSQH